MDKDTALDRLCRESVFMVSPIYAEMLANVFDVSLEKIGLEPKPAQQLAREALSPQHPDVGGSGGSVQIKHAHKNDRAVFVHELAARLAMHFGLYANIDHAMQSPYHRPASECRYIGCRAAIRLARLFGGGPGVAALRERNPWIEERLIKEIPWTGTGERLKA